MVRGVIRPIVATSVDTAQYVTTILVGRIKCDNYTNLILMYVTEPKQLTFVNVPN